MKIEFLHSKTPVEYEEAYKAMHARQSDVISGRNACLVWFLEHNTVITAGRRADKAELVSEELVSGNSAIKICEVERGGKYTFHNPGQLIVYFVIDLKVLYSQKPDIRRFVRNIEEVIILTLLHYGIKAMRHSKNIGIWVEVEDDVLHKIASIGLSVKKWVTMHGISINVNNNLDGYNHIIPCGIRDCEMTSIAKLLGCKIDMQEFADVLHKNINRMFNSTFVHIT